jgi:iron(III) transport system ATP-binding protein
MSVHENVAYGLSVSGASKAEVRERAEHGLALVNLAGYGKRLPSELSGGQQQRVAVARALVLEPSVLLFDEPLSNLDAKLRRQVRQDIRDLQQSLELTAVYVTHDQEEALAVSDRIIVMNQAVIAQDGTPRELYEKPADLFVADFIGDANLVDVRVVSRDGAAAQVDIGGVSRRLSARGISPGEATAAIRPEAVSVEIEPSPDRLPGTVRKAVYLGGHVEYDVETVLGPLFVIDHRTERLVEAGTEVHLGLAERGVTLVPRPA